MKKTEIFCSWMNNNTIVINSSGQVHPCCYLGNAESRMGFQKLPAEYNDASELMEYYYNNLDDYNIFKTPLDEIFKGEWFKMLQESWSTTPVRHCIKNCSRNIDQKQERSDEEL
jgi:hypothetical protein